MVGAANVKEEYPILAIPDLLGNVEPGAQSVQCEGDLVTMKILTTS